MKLTLKENAAKNKETLQSSVNAFSRKSVSRGSPEPKGQHRKWGHKVKVMQPSANERIEQDFQESVKTQYDQTDEDDDDDDDDNNHDYKIHNRYHNDVTTNQSRTISRLSIRSSPSAIGRFEYSSTNRRSAPVSVGVDGRTVTNELFDAVSRGDVMRARRVIGRGARVNVRDGQGQTLLMICLGVRSKEARDGMFRYLIDFDELIEMIEDVEERTERNVLQWAAYLGHYTQVRQILSIARGDINLNHKDKQGRTALHLAALEGHLKVVKKLALTLKKYSLSLDEEDNEGLTPLLSAARMGYRNIISELISAGASATRCDSRRYLNAEQWSTEGERERAEREKEWRHLENNKRKINGKLLSSAESSQVKIKSENMQSITKSASSEARLTTTPHRIDSRRATAEFSRQSSTENCLISGSLENRITRSERIRPYSGFLITKKVKASDGLRTGLQENDNSAGDLGSNRIVEDNYKMEASLKKYTYKGKVSRPQSESSGSVKVAFGRSFREVESSNVILEEEVERSHTENEIRTKRSVKFADNGADNESRSDSFVVNSNNSKPKDNLNQKHSEVRVGLEIKGILVRNESPEITRSLENRGENWRFITEPEKSRKDERFGSGNSRRISETTSDYESSRHSSQDDSCCKISKPKENGIKILGKNESNPNAVDKKNRAALRYAKPRCRNKDCKHCAKSEIRGVVNGRDFSRCKNALKDSEELNEISDSPNISYPCNYPLHVNEDVNSYCSEEEFNYDENNFKCDIKSQSATKYNLEDLENCSTSSFDSTPRYRPTDSIEEEDESAYKIQDGRNYMSGLMHAKSDQMTSSYLPPVVRRLMSARSTSSKRSLSSLSTDSKRSPSAQSSRRSTSALSTDSKRSLSARSNDSIGA